MPHLQAALHLGLQERRPCAHGSIPKTFWHVCLHAYVLSVLSYLSMVGWCSSFLTRYSLYLCVSTFHFNGTFLWYFIQIKGLQSIYLHIPTYDVVNKSVLLGFLNTVSKVYKVDPCCNSYTGYFITFPLIGSVPLFVVLWKTLNSWGVCPEPSCIVKLTFLYLVVLLKWVIRVLTDIEPNQYQCLLSCYF